MGEKYLIDTNIIIDFSLNKIGFEGRGFVASIIDGEPYISVINKIELLGFSVVSQEIIDFIACSYIIGLTDAVIDQTIALRRNHKIKLPNAIIAASAMSVNATLITRNLKDFQKVDGLFVIDPHEL